MEKVKKTITEGLILLEIEPRQKLIENFLFLLSELKKWNRAYNLTAIKGDEDIIIKHFFDSLLYLRFIPNEAYTLCDVGSGAGFPGLPIAFVREGLKITLLEPSSKKTAFLRHIKKKLSLSNVEIIQSRVEALKGFTFDIILTRALFTISEFIKKAGHLVHKNGFLIMSKGPALDDELREVVGNCDVEIVKAILPLTSIKRNIVKITLKSYKR